MVANTSRATYRGPSHGPTFGGEHDIQYFANNACSVAHSYTDFGELNDYSVLSEVQDKYTILAGTRYFSADDVEVFYLV